MDINVLTVQETILFLGLFLGLLISIGIAAIDSTLNNEREPSDVLLGLITRVFFQWFYAILTFAFITFWVVVISTIIGKL